MKVLWGRFRLLAWLWMCCHVRLPWLSFKHRWRERRRREGGRL